MRTPLGPSRTWGSLHRTVSTSDALVVTRWHARPTSSSTDALSAGFRCLPLAEPPRERIDLRAVGLRFPLTRLEMRRRSPRAPSVVSRPREPRPTDRMHLVDLFGLLEHPRTVSPSLCTRLASGEATSILPASALCAPRGLATPRRPRRAMRPTDVCHPNESERVPVPRAFLADSAACAACWSRRVWAPRDTTREGSVSRRSDLASAGLAWNAFVVRRESHPAVTTKGLFDPRRSRRPCL